MLDRLSRIQLTIFALVTVLAVGAISLFYLHLPAKVGLGTYKVDANFVAGGGIYQNANVTYRGVTIGRVDSVGLTDDGVIANMRLNSNTPVPDNVTATVKSVSAVGEQYIDLVPPAAAASSAAMLHDGATIGQDRTAVGQDIAGLLQQADQLVSSINNTRLKDLLRETFNAFNGSGPELARMIQSSRLLVDEANANAGQTTQLIDQAGPFLDAQIRSGDDIKALADGLARFTTELNNADPQVRALLQTAPGAADEINTAFTGIRPNFPMLAANLANLGPDRGHLPQVDRAGAGDLPGADGGVEHGRRWRAHRRRRQARLQGRPRRPADRATSGFMPASQIRSPADETLRDLPTDMYCKAAQNDPTVVRGARNYPCKEFPGKRAPTVQLCRDPVGYRSDRQQPVARSAHSLRHADPGRPEHPAAQQVPLHPTRGGLRSGPTGRPAPAGCGARSGARAERAVPVAGATERQRAATAVAVLRPAGSDRSAVCPPAPGGAGPAAGARTGRSAARARRPVAG